MCDLASGSHWHLSPFYSLPWNHSVILVPAQDTSLPQLLCPCWPCCLQNCSSRTSRSSLLHSIFVALQISSQMSSLSTPAQFLEVSNSLSIKWEDCTKRCEVSPRSKMNSISSSPPTVTCLYSPEFGVCIINFQIRSQMFLILYFSWSLKWFDQLEASKLSSWQIVESKCREI